MIYIEYPFTFLNEYIRLERANRYKGAKVKKDSTFALSMMLRGNKIETPTGLQFTWIVPNKKRDLDNISFGCKFLLDAMVKANVIPNDNLTHITELRHKFEIGNKVGVKIEVIK